MDRNCYNTCSIPNLLVRRTHDRQTSLCTVRIRSRIRWFLAWNEGQCGKNYVNYGIDSLAYSKRLTERAPFKTPLLCYWTW